MTSPSETVVAGERYEIEELLAQGGMADVYTGRDRVLGRRVAIKVLSPHHARDERLVARFRREATAAAKLNHPNIVRVYDWGPYGETYYIAMELVEGQTLADILANQGLLDPARAAGIAAAVARALEYAHQQGTVHRDIKPANILVAYDHLATQPGLVGRIGQVKVADFGIARAVQGDEDLTETGKVMGTATYLSPEQAQGQSVGPVSDLYSVGVLLFEMLTGDVPFDGPTPYDIAQQHVYDQPPNVLELNPQVPAGLAQVVATLLAKSPNHRYPSAQDLAVELAVQARGGNMTDQEYPDGYPPQPGQRRILGSGPDHGHPDGPSPEAYPPNPPNSEATQVLPDQAHPGPGYPPAQPAYQPAAQAQPTQVQPPGAVQPGMGGTAQPYPGQVASPDPTTYHPQSHPHHHPGQQMPPRAYSAPTGQVGLAGAPTRSRGHRGPGGPRSGDGDYYEPPNRSGWFLGGLAVLLVAAVIGVFYLANRIGQDDTSATEQVALVRVPTVLGEAEATATNRLQDAGLRVQTSFQASEGAEVGTVIDQDPEGGREVEPDSVVSLVVAAGSDAVEVPNVVGRQAAEAADQLRQLGFNVIIEREENASVASGEVIEQSIGAGEDANKGAIITLVVSAGATSEGQVPEVVGLSSAQATLQLGLAGFTNLAVTHEPNEEVPADTVMRLSHQAGATISLETTITLVVSSGPTSTTTESTTTTTASTTSTESTTTTSEPTTTSTESTTTTTETSTTDTSDTTPTSAATSSSTP